MAEEGKQRAIAGEDDDDDEEEEEEKESETETEGEELEGDEWEAVLKAKGQGDLIPREREKEREGESAAAAADDDSNSSKAKVEVVEAASTSMGQLGERRGGGATARHLFQRLWTDEEEIRILRGFLEFTRRRGTTFASHQYDTGPFYEEIRQQLHLDFSKNQLVEKLRRLKKKYRNCAARMRSKGPAFSFRSPHEHQIFDIARHIWRPANKRLDLHSEPDAEAEPEPDGSSFSFSFSSLPPSSSTALALAVDPGAKPNAPSSSTRRARRRRLNRDAPPPPPQPAVTVTAAIPVSISPPIHHHHHEAAAPVSISPPPPPPLVSSSSSAAAAAQDTLRSCLSPLFKELIGSAIGPSSLGHFSLGPVPACPPGKTADEKWRKQQILELEVYLQRIELVKEQVMQALQDLKGSTS